jgi:hypothetical protein
VNDENGDWAHMTSENCSKHNPSLLLWLPFLVRSIATGELLSQRRL